MQIAAWEHWERIAQTDEQPDRPDDFGWFGGWERAKEIGQVFAQYKILPSAGGWMDQTVADRHDILTYMSGANRAQWEHEEMTKPVKGSS